MSETSPWWGSGLFTVAGAVLGALAPLVLGLLNRRSERHRLSRKRKETDYPELVITASRLADIPVWPAEASEPDARYDELYALTQQVGFFSPANVAGTLPELLGAASALADTITKIRSDSRPTHGNGIDQRYRQQYSAAVTRLDQAISAFAAAARTDLEIPTPYTLVRPTRAELPG
jgi:hypothetical protein